MPCCFLRFIMLVTAFTVLLPGGSALLLSKCPTAYVKKPSLFASSRILAYEEDSPRARVSRIFHYIVKNVFPDLIRIINLFLNIEEKPVNNRPRSHDLKAIIEQDEREHAKNYYRRQLQELEQKRTLKGGLKQQYTSKTKTINKASPTTLTGLKAVLSENEISRSQKDYTKPFKESEELMHYRSPQKDFTAIDELSVVVQKAIQDKRKLSDTKKAYMTESLTRPDYVKEWQDYFGMPANARTPGPVSPLRASVKSIVPVPPGQQASPAAVKPDYIKVWQEYYSPSPSSLEAAVVAVPANTDETLKNALVPYLEATSPEVPIGAADISRSTSFEPLYDASPSRNTFVGFREIAAMLLLSLYAFTTAGPQEKENFQTIYTEILSGALTANAGILSPVPAGAGRLLPRLSTIVPASPTASVPVTASVPEKLDPNHVAPSQPSPMILQGKNTYIKDYRSTLIYPIQRQHDDRQQFWTQI